jgi:hypothetical protein
MFQKTAKASFISNGKARRALIIVKAACAAPAGEGQIVGLQSPQDWGERISVSGVYGSGASGGALINDYGEVIGILGGVLPESFLSAFSSQADSELVYATTGGTSVAASLLPKTIPASRSTLQDL